MRFALSLLIGSAVAAPGLELFERAACNADNCLRAVRATNASPFPSSATADCSRFQTTTVTPCPVTVTATTSVTTTAPTSTVVVSASTTTTSTSISTSVIEQTATVTVPSTIVVTQTSYSTSTSTVFAKRDAATLDPLPAALTKPAQLNARVVAPTCSASLTSSTSTPVYASACSGTVRYQSACSCAGITVATTTLAPVTVTTTTTSTITSTPITTITSTSTIVVPVTSVTLTTTTDATATTVSLTSTTTTVVVPTVVSQTCSTYKFVVQSGSLSGSYVTGDSPDDSIPYGFVTYGSSDASAAITFTIRPDTGVVYSNNVDRWITRAGQLYYVLQSADEYANAYNIDNVQCSVTLGASSFPGAAGTLACNSGGHSINFYTCPSTGDDLVQGTDSNSAGYGCTQYDVAAIHAC